MCESLLSGEMDQSLGDEGYCGYGWRVLCQLNVIRVGLLMISVVIVSLKLAIMSSDAIND